MVKVLNYIDPDALICILDHLMSHKLAVNRYRQKVGEGRSQCFGIVRKRCLAPDLSRQSWLDPYLHFRLMEFGRVYVPVPFTSIQVNDSFICGKHRDKNNEGESYIIGFGDYEGGELVVSENGIETEYDIKYHPLLFNGSMLEHWTKPFTGRRFTIVYHTTVAPSRFPTLVTLEDYEAVRIQETGHWLIKWTKSDGSIEYLGGKKGLPHPLRGYKRLNDKKKSKII